MRTALFLLSLTSIFLVGCLSPAKRLEPQVVNEVKQGLVRRDVEKIMGKPNYVVTGSAETKVAHYGFVRRNDSAEYLLIGNFASNPGDIVLRHLSVLYNQNNIADKVLYYQSITPFKTAIGRASVGAVVQPEAIRKIMKGISTEESLINLFGEPQLKALDPDGNVILEWYYAKSQMGWIRNKDDRQVLSVTLDNSGVVKEHTLTGNIDP